MNIQDCLYQLQDTKKKFAIIHEPEKLANINIMEIPGFVNNTAEK